MDRAPFDTLEKLAKAADITIEGFFDNTQSLASSLFLRRGNMDRQAQVLAAFTWPATTTVECAGNEAGILANDHCLVSQPVGILLPRRVKANPADFLGHLTERGQLAQWLFRNSFSAIICDACCIADSIGGLLMRGYLNPKQAITRCGIMETYDWAKAQPLTNTVAKQIASLLLAHAGPDTWRVCVSGIRNELVHGTNERLVFASGQPARISFSSDGGKSAQQRFIRCFGPGTDIDLSDFSNVLCARVDKLLYDCTSGAFAWPRVK